MKLSVKTLALPILMAALAVFTISCVTTQDDPGARDPVVPAPSRGPQWIETGDVKGYPVGSFIRARGVSPPEHIEADALDLARVNALTQISEQIMTRVKSQLDSIQRQLVHNDEIDSFEDVAINTRVETSELLAGATKVEEWYDAETGTAYVFLVMNRLALSERLCTQATDKKKEALGYLDSSRSALEKKDFTNALKSVVHARRAAAVALSNHAKALAVGTDKKQKSRFDALDLGGLWNDVVQDHDRQTSAIQLKVMSGNEQVANLSGDVKEQIVVKVTGPGGKPLAGFPMKVRLAEKIGDGATVIPRAETTNDKGLFAFSLKELAATGSHANAVKVELDFAAIEERSDAVPPNCTVTYLMPTMETTKIAVVICETIEGKETPKSILGEAIKVSLNDLGFQVTSPDLGGKSPKQVANLSTKAVAKLFGRKYDYVIVGTAESEFSSNTALGICFKTRVSLDALELETSKTIPFAIGRGQESKGFGNNNRQAAEDSLKKAARAMVGDGDKQRGLLGEKFAARFESGGDWEE